MNKEIKFTPAYDKRSSDPKKNYGIHGVMIYFYLKGELGAVQFVVYTHWQLPHVQADIDAKPPDPRFPYMFHEGTAWDLGYHSAKPMYEGQTKISDQCELLGGPCYYDGSTLNAEPVFDTLRAEGDDGVWKKLEEYYHQVFGELR
jgi:hypothetical protein